VIYALQVELSKEKIALLRKKIERKNSVFKDKKYLDSLFLPSKILGRQKQAEQLIQYIDSLKEGLLVPVISVYGRSGAGKSTVVKFVCQNMSDVLLFSFVNLRKAKTVFGCANLILSELGLANLKSAQGMNKAIDSMEGRILEILDKEDKKFFVLILDEYDSILPPEEKAIFLQFDLCADSRIDIVSAVFPEILIATTRVFSSTVFGRR